MTPTVVVARLAPPLRPSLINSGAAMARTSAALRSPGTIFNLSSTLHSVRHSSHSPLGTPQASTRKVTITALRNLYKRGEPIVMLTAHDFPSAHVADAAGIDMVLVGDSLAMVALGMQDTSELTLGEMILHCRSVSRAVKSAFTVCLECIRNSTTWKSLTWILITDCRLADGIV
jgi:3-methyl-2-oxobutanoate hydroxymethyltransferase